MLKLLASKVNLKSKFITNLLFSGEYSNFEKFLPFSFGFGMVYTSVYRCFCIYSVWTRFHSELTFFKEIFCENVCSGNFIDKCFNTFLDYVHFFKEIVSTVEK